MDQVGFRAEIRKLLTTINTIVNEEGRPYKEKAQYILGECDEVDRTNLSEFIAWFDDILD